LQPTALVNEAYLKLFGHSEIQFVDRAHLFPRPCVEFWLIMPGPEAPSVVVQTVGASR
jgi:hypothetical protein